MMVRGASYKDEKFIFVLSLLFIKKPTKFGFCLSR